MGNKGGTVEYGCQLVPLEQQNDETYCMGTECNELQYSGSRPEHFLVRHVVFYVRISVVVWGGAHI